ncbi:MAG: tRNA lysidine(34) synthetase TilS [Planctomycetes bacterium]|nr:tRNA lysidine(34) synthetase TilS [Planctomycetota bacterium]
MNTPSSLLAGVERWLCRLGVKQKGMVVAVSGGPDSVALLRALLALRGSPPPPLVIAHLNHQLRGSESDADEAFVHELHDSLVSLGHADLGLCCERIDVAAIAAAENANLEDTARRVRYDWLARVARQHGLGIVVTGHTTDDQAETVLHRLLRGAGLQGLRGIAPRRPLAEGVEVVRPLLDVTRAEVLAFLEAERQPARQDRSNDDLRFTRNRIRHELLPYLAEHYNPAVCEVFARLARQAEEAHQELDAAACALLAEAERPRAGPLLIFDRGRLAATSRHRVRLLFRRVWEREGWPLGEMSFDHWQRLEAVVFDDLTAACWRSPRCQPCRGPGPGP